MSLALRPYQEEAIAAVHDAAGRDVTNVLVALPTGTGKTVVFAHLIRSVVETGGTALVLAHREELLQQAADKLITVMPELAMGVGFVQAARDDVGAQVVVGSVATLSQPHRLERLPREFDLVIVDEAHHATAASYRTILDRLDVGLVAGFTATPERHDDDRLSDVFEEIVYARSIEEMIRAGYLCDLRGVRVALADLDLSKVKVNRGEYQASDLGRALTAAHAPEQTAAALAAHARDRKSIVFVPTVDLAHETAEAARQAGFRAAALDGKTPVDDRKGIITALASGDLEVVVNVDVLTEGFDEPSVDCVCIAAPTRSRIVYVQRVGRGTRLHPGKQDCLVLDLVGSTEELRLQSLPDLFDLDAPPDDGETVTEALAREAAGREGGGPSGTDYVGDGEQTARQVPLFDRNRLHWLEVDGRWVLPAGNESIVLDEVREGAYRVLLLGENRARILARDLDLGYAQGAAEEAVRRREAVALADREAAWRRRRPSGGQIGYLRRLGIFETPDTSGEASDLINAALVSERLARLDAALAARGKGAAA